MDLKLEKVCEISSALLSVLFLSLKDNSVLEVLAAAVYATEKFKTALIKLDVIPESLSTSLYKEIGIGAVEDVDEKLLEKVKTLLVNESQEGE